MGATTHFSKCSGFDEYLEDPGSKDGSLPCDSHSTRSLASAACGAETADGQPELATSALRLALLFRREFLKGVLDRFTHFVFIFLRLRRELIRHNRVPDYILRLTVEYVDRPRVRASRQNQRPE